MPQSLSTGLTQAGSAHRCHAVSGTGHRISVRPGPISEVMLLPHRDLGGYSLVLWFDAQQLSLMWAGVTDLERHDDLDLGRLASRLHGANRGSDEAVKAALAAELSRPIHVTLHKTRIRRRWQLSCAVELSGRWSDSYVCDVAPPSIADGA